MMVSIVTLRYGILMDLLTAFLQASADLFQLLPPAAVGEKAVVANTHEALRVTPLRGRALA